MKSDISCQVSTTIDAPAAKVWEALTEPGIIKKYFFGTQAKTDWKVGHPVTFKGKWKGRSYEDKGKVLNYEARKLLRYKYWSSLSGIEDKPENYVTVTYKLSENDNHETRLTIKQENIPDIKTKEHSEENWKDVLENLKILLEKGVESFA